MKRTTDIEVPDVEEERERTERRMLNRAQEIAKRLAPVGSGLLRANIQTSDHSIFNTVPYAPLVHDGTADQMPRPYLRQAIVRALNEESR